MAIQNRGQVAKRLSVCLPPGGEQERGSKESLFPWAVRVLSVDVAAPTCPQVTARRAADDVWKRRRTVPLRFLSNSELDANIDIRSTKWRTNQLLNHFVPRSSYRCARQISTPSGHRRQRPCRRSTGALHTQIHDASRCDIANAHRRSATYISGTVS